VIRRFLNRRWYTFFFVQANGSAVSLYAAMKASMCCCNCSTAVKEAPLGDWLCRIENHISTLLSHDDRVGVKWKWTLRCFLSQRSFFLWVLRLSMMT
jgi:hypothetical protein